MQAPKQSKPRPLSANWSHLLHLRSCVHWPVIGSTCFVDQMLTCSRRWQQSKSRELRIGASVFSSPGSERQTLLWVKLCLCGHGPNWPEKLFVEFWWCLEWLFLFQEKISNVRRITWIQEHFYRSALSQHQYLSKDYMASVVSTQNRKWEPDF